MVVLNNTSQFNSWFKLLLFLHELKFLAHLIDFYQMCYCYRKLEKLVILCVWEAKFGRPWEAVGGRGRPWEAVGGPAWPWEAVLPWLAQTDQIRSQSQSESTASHTASHGLPRPPTASQFRPPIASHRLGLPQFVMWSVWANHGSTASHESSIWEADQTLLGEAMRLAVKSVRCARGSHCLAWSPIAWCAWEADLRGRSDSTGRSNAFSREINQTARGSDCIDRCAWEANRPPTDRSHDFVVRGWSASHAHRSDSTGWSNAFSHEISQTAPRIKLHHPVCVRGRSASQITWLCGERPCLASHGLPPRPPTTSHLYWLIIDYWLLIS